MAELVGATAIADFVGRRAAQAVDRSCGFFAGKMGSSPSARPGG